MYRNLDELYSVARLRTAESDGIDFFLDSGMSTRHLPHSPPSSSDNEGERSEGVVKAEIRSRSNRLFDHVEDALNTEAKRVTARTGEMRSYLERVRRNRMLQRRHHKRGSTPSVVFVIACLLLVAIAFSAVVAFLLPFDVGEHSEGDSSI